MTNTISTKPATRGNARAARDINETGVSDASAARAIIETREQLTALPHLESSSAALIPLIAENLLTPYVNFARDAYKTADSVLKKTPKRHFEIADTVFNGLAHARGLSEARVLLMEKVTEELAEKVKGGPKVENVEGWREQGVCGEEVLREWLGEILDDLGGEGW